MKQNLLHILDSSVCITKRQLKEYATGTIADEERHAMEHHINGCLFCSEAVDGALFHTSAETLEVTAHLNNSFLKAHFDLSNPQVHLNSIGPSLKSKSGKHTIQPFWLKTSLVAVLVIGAAVVLLIQTGKGGSAFNLKHLSTHKEAAKILTMQAIPASAITSAAVASK